MKPVHATAVAGSAHHTRGLLLMVLSAAAFTAHVLLIRALSSLG